MTAGPFQAALAGKTPDYFQIGQLLEPDELPARISDLQPDMQRAISIAHDCDRLDWFGRQGWRRAGLKAGLPISNGTVNALHRHGLVVIVSAGRFRKHARITARGQWFARTVNTRTLERIRQITREITP